MRLLISVLAGLVVFSATTALWFYWPTWQVEVRVKARLAERDARLSSVTYNKTTGSGCGYVSGQSGRGSPVARRHFVLMADGNLQLDPVDRLQGSTLHRLETLKKQTEYLTLVYAHCAHG
ncbi:MAG: hypothetical protein KKC79_21275 [Gammaproteobacteria bacterium]|nr:hypothetical protein [Gammaproteobacteria bacterium]MBU1441441.1 hypothetical protein [Gammaproteobacteria bacterium]MBU2288848.1 hypothetical protein [Gammaproteobacteria bacterium]MBU2411171.1 hypothetical protein [Gammaproteobacteria bacterium]